MAIWEAIVLLFAKKKGGLKTIPIVFSFEGSDK